MTIFVKINVTSVDELETVLEKIADIRAALTKKCPDIVVNVEVEMK